MLRLGRDSDWRGELLKDDKRWVYGVPPASNANYAWVQHFIHHLAPTGLAGFVLASGSMSLVPNTSRLERCSVHSSGSVVKGSGEPA